MSGQPSRTVQDQNKFRNEYLQTLALQEQINSMNLDVNKNYLLTGQLPPSAQILDTRTTSEKLKDIELMKQTIASEFKGLYTTQASYAIVDKIMNHPLNVEGSLLKFLAQRANELAQQLKKFYSFGIEGDINDIDTFVNYVVNIYTNTQENFKSIKEYNLSQNSQGTNNKIVGKDDMNMIIAQIQELKNNMRYLKNEIPTSIENEIDDLFERLHELQSKLPTTEELNIVKSNIDNIDDEFSNRSVKILFDFLEALPKFNIINSLVDKSKRALNSKNYKVLSSYIKNIDNEFSNTYKFLNNPDLFNIINDIKDDLQEEIHDIRTNQLNQERALRHQKTLEDKALRGVQEVRVVNPEDDAVWVRNSNFGIQQPIQQTVNLSNNNNNENIDNLYNDTIGKKEIPKPNYPAPNPHKKDDNYIQDIKNKLINIDEIMNEILEEYGMGEINDDEFEEEMNYLEDKKNILLNELDKSMKGEGIKKKRGRMKGKGIYNYGDFGDNQINIDKLNKNILTMRRKSKTNIPEFPSKTISTKMKNIVNNIIGGKVLNYSDLNSLDDEEKEYLYKIVKKSNLEDRLSVPAPSKDQEEKDIHNFEVMKGEILSGNDSKEMVKKFKVLVLKLSRNNLLPKKEVEDLLETLVHLGY